MALKIDTLVTHHQHLLAIVNKINTLAPEREGAAIAGQLEAFKTALVAHLETEDRELYPALRTVGERADAPLSLKTNIKNFFDEMEGLKPVVVGFLGRWSGGAIAANPSGFRAEFAELSQALGNRIAREESRLYPLYNQYVGVPAS